MKKLALCAHIFLVTSLAANVLTITVTYEKSVNSLYSTTISIDESETLQNLITKITGDISLKENGYTVLTCKNGKGKNLLEQKLQRFALKKVFKTTRPTLWINC